MELSREQPPTYVSHDPKQLDFPSVPRQEIRSPHQKSDLTLPNLRTVLAGLPERTSEIPPSAIGHRQTLRSPQLAPTTEYSRGRNHGAFRPVADPAILSPSDTASVVSYDEPARRSTSVVSLEDPDVRLAAEALSGLGNPDFMRSPAIHSANKQSYPPTSRGSQSNEQGPEPLLELLVDAHPWVGGTINTSLSAYTMTKNYSPRFVKYSADLIERNIGSPMVNTMSSVGKRTGVEGGIRRYLGGRRPSDLERADANTKRRRVGDADGEAMDVDTDANSAAQSAVSSRRESHEFLPAYRSSKPPSYREEVSPSSTERQQLRMRPPHNRGWGTQLMISTSGLGVALSESSLRSLTYCVSLLTKASEHVATVMNALIELLRDFDQAQESRQREQNQRAKEVEAGMVPRDQVDQEEAARQMADRIKQLCDDIWQTMKTVVNSVSTYAGGALPENARRIVKSQLMSIPQRYRLASETAAQQDQQMADGESSSEARPETELRNTGHRMIAFAEEGLDMMAQVNGVVKITLQSAEDWLKTFGRRERSDEQQVAGASDPRYSGQQ